MASDHRIEITHLGWNVLVECFPMISEADAEELKHRLPFPKSPADSTVSAPETKHDHQHASPSTSTSSSTASSSSDGQTGDSKQKEPEEKAGEDHHHHHHPHHPPSHSHTHHDHSHPHHHHHHHHHQSGEEEEKKAAPVAVHFLPEMVFDRNVIRLKYEAGDVSINFEVKQALEEWLQSPLEPLKVAASKQWEKYHVPEFATPDFDWTFSTRYRGTITRLSTGEPLAPSWTQASELVAIDFELLKRRDPIVLYSELVLFEDELADNGVSKLSCRIRVMPTCLYILQRFWCRVDDVLFRVFDTRIFHKFGSPVLVRDFQWFENTYEDLQARGQIPADPSKLADENIMVPRLTQKLHQIEGFDVSQKPSSS